jgi:hypothetical protein
LKKEPKNMKKRMLLAHKPAPARRSKMEAGRFRSGIFTHELLIFKGIREPHKFGFDFLVLLYPRLTGRAG